ncbi:MAG: LamG-like jellyroll fold domain-containing protein [Armatimonadota bacterium]
MQRAFCVIAILGTLIALCAPAVTAEAPVDAQTTFVARFDDGLAAEVGPADASGDDWTLVPGRYGSALRLEDGQVVTYPVEGLIGTAQGTIELWMKRWWQPDDDVKSRVVGWQTPANNYLRVNFVNAHRLGVSMNGGPEGATVWHRVDYDPTGWADETWYHVAAVWEGGAIRFYVDGEQVGSSRRSSPMVEAPATLEIGRGPVLIDDLRISDIARTSDEIREAFTGRKVGAVTLLTDFEVTDAAQALGEVGIDAQRGVDDRTMPLMSDHRHYERGVGLRAPGHVSFDVPEGFARLTGEVGACDFADAPPAEVAISLDGTEVLSAEVSMGAGVTPFDIALPGACTVRIDARAEPIEGGMIVVGDPVLTPNGETPPETFARSAGDAAVEVQRMRMDATRFHFDLPEAVTGYALYPGHPVDPIDPSQQPPKQLEMLRIDAAPGEFEAAQFALHTGIDLTGVRVSCSDLAVEVRLLRRCNTRRHYKIGRAPGNYAAVSRFVFPNRDFWLPAGHFKQVHLIVQTPEDAAGGQYAGTVTIEADGMPPAQIPLDVGVRPIQLLDPPEHGYSMYYNARNEARDRPELFRAELRNMREHGCTMLKPRGTNIVFEEDEDGQITWHLDEIRMVLEVLQEEGFGGPIPIGDGAKKLGDLLGLTGLTRDDRSDPLHESAEARRIMGEALAGLEALNAEYPGFEILTQHGDEVMGDAKRYPFIDQSKLVNPRTDLRNYMTVHMMPGRWEEPMAEIDEFIDIRCLNGHSLEEWLRDGHDFDELARIGEESGDELWIYHNMRGVAYMPEWNRILQGVYMWQSPIRIHVPWMWNSFGGSAFNDTDAEKYDFGYAFPLDDRGEQIVSTLHWEACREGYDDMRYIATLEDAIERAQAQGVDTADAESALDKAAAMLPKLPDEIEQVEGESPLLIETARRHSGADWDAMREELAREIVALEGRL